GCAAPGSVEKADAIDKDLLDEKLRVYVSLEGLQGFEWGSATAELPDDFKDQALANTDALIIRRAGDRELNVRGHNGTVATVTLWENHSYAAGSTLMVSDASCRNVGLFQMSGPATVPAQVIHHQQAGTSNCTSIIKGHFSCSVSPGPPAPPASSFYASGSKIMEFVAHAYYIGESTVMPGMPALRRQVFNANGAASTTSEEIALGVEDMEILYGVDSNNDGNVEQMRKASEITSET